MYFSSIFLHNFYPLYTVCISSHDHYKQHVGQVARTPYCGTRGANNPGSFPGGGVKKGNLFPCCFPVFRRALKAVGPVGQEPVACVSCKAKKKYCLFPVTF